MLASPQGGEGSSIFPVSNNKSESKERLIHEAFAEFHAQENALVRQTLSSISDRVTQSHNVSGTADISVTSVIDSYCSDESFHEVKKPLVILGEIGCGKSFTLSNWASERKIFNSRPVSSEREFLFEYYVSTSRRSVFVTNFLYELLSALKDFFQLNIEVKDSEAKLSADFSRCLEAASTKGKIVIVLDGVEKMVSNNGEVAGLRWLPFNFPANVRIIMSCSLPLEASSSIFITSQNSTGSTQSQRKSTPNSCKIAKEASRRRWMVHNMKKKTKAEIKGLILGLLSGTGKSISISKLSDLGKGKSHNQNHQNIRRKGSLESRHGNVERKEPIRLLASQVESICNLDMSSNLRFLFILLRSIRLAASYEMDVTRLIDCCLEETVDSVQELIYRILIFFKNGNVPSKESIYKAWKFAKSNNSILLPRTTSLKGLPSPEVLKIRKNIEESLKAYHTSSNEEAGSDAEEDYNDDDFEDEAEGNEVKEENKPSTINYLEGMSHVPIYLLGGRPTDGLGHILFQTIGLLYNARYGLSLKEVFDIIEQESKEKHGINSNETKLPKNKLVDEAGFNFLDDEGIDDISVQGLLSVTKNKQEKDFSVKITPLQRTVLYRLLHCMETISVDELIMLPVGNRSLCQFVGRKVLNLPLLPDIQTCPETPKTKKRNKSISETPCHSQWKNALTEYFEGLKPCTRKIEELPWLYERSGKWTSLQEFISNIVIFRVIWAQAPRSRSDLIRYWRVLSNTSKPEIGYTAYQILAERYHSQEGDDFKLLKRSPSTKSFNGSKKLTEDAFENVESFQTTRRYDPVDEYNKSLEKWRRGVLQNKPLDNSQQIDEVQQRRSLIPSEEDFSKVVSTLTEFFWEFGIYENAAPQYFHPQIDESRLTSLELLLPHADKHFKHVTGTRIRDINLSKTARDLKSFNSKTKQALADLRFPKTGKISTPNNISTKARRTSIAHRSLGLGIQSKQIEEEVNTLYSYQRWIWMQFPWIARARAGFVYIPTHREKANSIYVPKLKSSKSLNSMRKNETEKRFEDSISKLQKSTKRLSFWQRKKIDPNQDRERPPRPSILITSSKETMSDSPKFSYLFDADNDIPDSESVLEDDYPVLSNEEREARSEYNNKIVKFFNQPKQGENKAFGLITKFFTQQPKHILGPEDPEEECKIESTDGKITETVQVSINSNQPEVDIMKLGHGPSSNQKLPPGITPFSSPSIRTIRTGTRFPTFEAMRRENPTIEGDQIFSGGYVDRKKGTTASGHPDTTAHLLHLPAHLQASPTTEHELRSAEVKGLLAQLRKDYDQKIYESAIREKKLGELMQLAHERAEQDDFTESCISTGEVLMEELSGRLNELLDKIEQNDKIGRFYRRIVKVCEDFPAEEEKHMRFVEASLKKLRSEIQDLEDEKDTVKNYIKKTNYEEKPKLLEALDNRREMHNTVIRKLQATRNKQARALRYKMNRNKNRENLINTIQRDLDESEEAKLWKLNLQQQLYQTHLDARAEAERKKLQKYERLYQRIKLATGVEDPSEIYTKFINGDVAAKELRSQVQEGESKISMLKKKLTKSVSEVNSLKFGGDVVSSRVIRKVDESVIHAESRLKTARENYAQTKDTLIKSKEGLVNIAKMLRLFSKKQIAEINAETKQNETFDAFETNIHNNRILQKIRESLAYMIERLNSDGITLDNITECTLTATRPEKRSPKHAAMERRSLVEQQSSGSKSEESHQDNKATEGDKVSSSGPTKTRGNFLYGRAKPVEFPPAIVLVPTSNRREQIYCEKLKLEIPDEELNQLDKDYSQSRQSLRSRSGRKVKREKSQINLSKSKGSKKKKNSMGFMRRKRKENVYEIL